MLMPIVPNVRLIDPDDLELSYAEDDNKQFLDSLEHLEDIDVLLARSKDEEKQMAVSDGNGARGFLWMVVNVLASIAIVFLNESLFAPTAFKNAQLSFATFHFAMASLSLCALSRPRFSIFEAKRAPLFEMLPLALVLCGAVILPNFSLAYASIPFYQIVRETLTPIVDAMNFILRVPQPNVPRMALVSLLPMCIGVYIVTYYQYLAADEPGTEKSVGISAALFGVLVSACYITSMDLFQRRFQIDSRQLALNQAPLAGIALLYILPWADTFPNAREVPLGIWARLLLSGLCTCTITVSQAHVAAEASAVSNTVAARVIIISIMTIDWISGGSGLPYQGSLGLSIAIIGIVAYSTFTLRKISN